MCKASDALAQQSEFKDEIERAGELRFRMTC